MSGARAEGQRDALLALSRFYQEKREEFITSLVADGFKVQDLYITGDYGTDVMIVQHQPTGKIVGKCGLRINIQGGRTMSIDIQWERV